MDRLRKVMKEGWGVKSPPKPKLLRATMPCLNSVGSVTTLRMPSFRPALLGLGVVKCRLPGSVWCSYDSSTLIRAAHRQECLESQLHALYCYGDRL